MPAIAALPPRPPELPAQAPGFTENPAGWLSRGISDAYDGAVGGVRAGLAKAIGAISGDKNGAQDAARLVGALRKAEGPDTSPAQFVQYFIRNPDA